MLRQTTMKCARTFTLIATLFVSGSALGDDNNQDGTAIFAGGCFWCMEPPFDALDGVLATTSGYTGGHVDNPSYEEVVREQTGHREVVMVRYDPAVISYQQLLEVFWRNIDPVDAGGQFCDRGFSYSSAIFVANAAQRQAAEDSLAKLKASERFSGQTIVTPIIGASTFWEAEQYHQSYYRKNPVRYRYYRYRCGRDERLKSLWGGEEQLNLFRPESLPE